MRLFDYVIGYLIIILIFPFPALVSAQESIYKVPLTFKKESHISYFPFKTVRVLDNRLDTTKVFTYENGDYPPVSLSFANTTRSAIEKYIIDATNEVPKGNKSLLINITQLRVSNVPTVLEIKRGKPHNHSLRSFISFSADAYCDNGNDSFQEIISINKRYYYYGVENLTGYFPRVINELIEALSIAEHASDGNINRIPGKLKYLLKDSNSFQFKGDSNQFHLSAIDVNVKESWKKYPIVKGLEKVSGLFVTFDDFRNNHFIGASFKIQNSSKDSLYRIDVIKADTVVKNAFIYAISDGNELYKRIFENYYLKLNRCDNSFCFHIPFSLPDMYAVLSMVNMGETSSSFNSSSGNLLIDLAAIGAIVGVSGINDVYAKKSANKIAKRGLLSADYRDCFIDMDSGDINY